MKHLFIVNPAAGKVNHTPRIQTLAKTLCQGEEYQVVTSQGFGDCQRIAREAGESGDECLLYACGGDGTLNEVVSGAMGYENLAVTCCPCGSGNDFVKQFHNPQAFFKMENFRSIRKEQIDVMRVNDRYAVNVCSVGFDARIGTDINAFRRHPLLSGPRAYHASVVVNLLRGVSKPCRVELPGEEPIDGDQTLVCVLNGSWYGGSYHPVPEASIQDGMLDVLVVKKVSRITVAQVISAYQKGNYASRPDLIQHFRVPSLRIETPEPEPVNLDGELLRTPTVEIQVLPSSLTFFAPETAWQGEKDFF
jgi:YegS/Rv2252/BmrU family lipid kinase